MSPMGVDARVAREGVDVDEEAMWMRGPEGPLPWVVWRPRVDAKVAREVVDARMAMEGANMDVEAEALWMRGPEGPMPWVVWRPRV